jgi:hypothetical protein
MLPGYVCSVCALLGISVPQLSVLPLDISVLQQPALPIDVSVQLQPLMSREVSGLQLLVLHLYVSVPQQPALSREVAGLSAACAAPRRVCLQDPVHPIRVCRRLLCWTWTCLCTLHLYVSVHRSFCASPECVYLVESVQHTCACLSTSFVLSVYKSQLWTSTCAFVLHPPVRVCLQYFRHFSGLVLRISHKNHALQTCIAGVPLLLCCHHHCCC